MPAKPIVLKCRFRGASTAVNSVNIGITLDRETISPADVDALLVGSTATVKLTCDPNAKGDTAGQQTLKPNDGISLDVEGEFRSVTTTPEHYTTTLKCHREDTDLTDLDAFSFHAGTITVKRTGDAAKVSDEE